ncbi:MAG: ABC transporter substrate-binding protein [Alphaproteobacteria bacterium]|jgi:NitT/TauT family transport system substrate-binding protein|nr:ABC transporter substrate-binding protein [Alphaproteobacteria bacterium]
MRLTRRAALALGATTLTMPALAQAPAPIRLGLLRTASPAPLYIAQERGWFREAGVEVQFRFFDAAQPIAAAAVSGDTDMGITALTGGFFALAGRGELVVIGGGLHEQRGLKLTAVLVSKKAYDAGLTSLDKLGGKSFGITQYGSSFHYMAGRLAETQNFDLKSLTLRPLQTVQNMVAAVRTGQVDATMAIASMATPAAASGEAVIIGWVGDHVPYQITALFASKAMVGNRADDLRKFATAYRRGITSYREAFLRLDASGTPQYGPATDAAIADITKYVFVGDPAAGDKIKAGLGWYDEGGALNVADVRNQLTWFSAQGMVKGEVDAGAIIDTRFLPTR